jgi:hypothetical protein
MIFVDLLLLIGSLEVHYRLGSRNRRLIGQSVAASVRMKQIVNLTHNNTSIITVIGQ